MTGFTLNCTQEAADDSTPNCSQEVADDEIFNKLEEYPWSTDGEFQHGLQAILGQNLSPEQAQHLTLKARCFYYSRQD